MNRVTNVLVTGGAGFIGSHLVDRLLATSDFDVTVVDDFNDFYDPAIKRRNLASSLSHSNFRLIEGDISEEEVQRRLLMSPFDVIIHLGARAGVRPSLQDPLLYQRVNVAGTYRMLELARAQNVKKFIFGSSSSVYGLRSGVPFVETDAVGQPASPYAATKIAAEAACHAYSHLYAIPMLCLRFFTVFGPRQRPDLAIHKFVRLMSTDKPVPVFGDGSSARDYTYVDDVVDAIMRAVTYEGSHFEIINIGREQPTKLIDLVRLIGELLGVDPHVEWLPDQPGDVLVTWADSSKARKLLGFSPQVSIHEGVSHFVNWVRKNENDLANVETR